LVQCGAVPESAVGEVALTAMAFLHESCPVEVQQQYFIFFFF